MIDDRRRYGPDVTLPAQMSKSGEATRRGILEALRKDLTYLSWREISVKSLAHQVHRVPGTFYQYWSSVEDAFGALCALIRAEGEGLTPHMLVIEELLELEATLGAGDA